MVSQRTGMPATDAQQRVTTIYARAKATLDDTATMARQKADDARKATAYTALWMVVALLAGAFVSAWLATFGGRQRDAAAMAAAERRRRLDGWHDAVRRTLTR